MSRAALGTCVLGVVLMGGTLTSAVAACALVLVQLAVPSGVVGGNGGCGVVVVVARCWVLRERAVVLSSRWGGGVRGWSLGSAGIEPLRACVWGRRWLWSVPPVA